MRSMRNRIARLESKRANTTTDHRSRGEQLKARIAAHAEACRRNPPPASSCSEAVLRRAESSDPIARAVASKIRQERQAKAVET